MRRERVLLAIVGVLGSALPPLPSELLGAHSALAQSDRGPVPYVLTDESSIEIGCQPPCQCPILILEPLRGSFRLSYRGSEPLLRHYDITDVHWSYQQGDSVRSIRGSGTYDIGGEFAIEHRLRLDLVIDGQAPQHFDSGRQSGGGEFPALRIDSAVHEFVCFDSIIHLRAKPAVASVGGLAGAVPRLSSHPNPFRLQTELELFMPEAGPVQATIVDLGGRRIRTLSRTVFRDAGTHRLSWDGRDDDGNAAPAGMYFGRAGNARRSTWIRIVKLD